MILGILIRDYKCYNNLQFIPIASDDKNKYTVFIGNNGVGKSTVLESLDTFFNNREWNINKNGRKDEAFVAPIFLIKKDELIDSNDDNVIILLDAISEYYWKVTEAVNPIIKTTPGILKFLSLRDELIAKGYTQEDYYFLILGIDYNDRVYFSTFNKNIIEEIKKVLNLAEEEVINQFNLLRKFILERYSYIYIPVEMPISQVLKMQTQQMQTLMNKDILEEIDAVLREKVEIKGNSKKLSFIDFINDHLNNFMKDINTTVRLIDESYTYDVGANKRKNLTPTHIREKILEAYFPIRTLKRNKREISELSSGEQRKALIDIIYAFLTLKGERDKKIIIAIDEPESSMHVSNCFRQFQRLEELAGEYNNQILITTHWYGFMPITDKGTLVFIDTNTVEEKVRSFDFNNYLEEKRRYPESIELKSMFDLVTSILSYMKSGSSENWIICEGSKDKLYLQTILAGKNESFIILPVGGCGNVIKLFQLLYGPVSEKTEAKSIGGKVLCLIDTDEVLTNIDIPFSFSGNARDKVFLRRLQVVPEGIRLFDPFKSGQRYERTEIEDCLEPLIFFKTIKHVLLEEKDIDIDKFFDYDSNAVTSKVLGDESILKPKVAEAIEIKKEINAALETPRIKSKLAEKYVEICKEKENVDHELGMRILEVVNPSNFD